MVGDAAGGYELAQLLGREDALVGLGALVEAQGHAAGPLQQAVETLVEHGVGLLLRGQQAGDDDDGLGAGFVDLLYEVGLLVEGAGEGAGGHYGHGPARHVHDVAMLCRRSSALSSNISLERQLANRPAAPAFKYISVRPVRAG